MTIKETQCAVILADRVLNELENNNIIFAYQIVKELKRYIIQIKTNYLTKQEETNDQKET